MNNTNNSNKTEKKDHGFYLSYVDLIAIFLVVFMLTAFVFNFIFTIHIVPSGSMEPTIKTGSIVIGYRLPYLLGDPMPKRGDVITFYVPSKYVPSSAPTEGKELFIKRVVGRPDDEITFDGGYLVVNGEKKTDEDYVMKDGTTWAPYSGASYYVPDDCVFVMGDNRTDSDDSRYLPFTYINRSTIYSKMLFSFKIPFYNGI